jgi:hypothetical protein
MFVRKRAGRLRPPSRSRHVGSWALLGCSLACSEPTPITEEIPLSDEDDPGNAAISLASEQFDAAELAPGDTLDGPDTTGGAWRIIEVPGSSLVHSPVGWLALRSRALGDSRVPWGHQSALHRSTDGVHWVSLPLPPQHDDLLLRRLAYGAGRYLMMGDRAGAPVVWTSVDAEHWQERALPPSAAATGQELSYAQHRFFSSAAQQLGVSETGRDWKTVSVSLLQGGAVAYGNGVYLLAGNGPMWTSTDGWAWQEHVLDCALPGACFGDGTDHQGIHPFPFFAEGRFYSGELSSEDGERWESTPGRAASAYVSGHFLGPAGAWLSGGAVQPLRVVRPSPAELISEGRSVRGEHPLAASPLPDSIDVSFEDGLTCDSAACVLIGGQLLLVPPPGTPPLPDRVPRRADGQPLLSRDCPVSSMIWCDDYDARTGCVCNGEAPATPDWCDDVSQYRCAGQFTHRPNEWQLDQIAEGGCSCDALDPNQPPGLGARCFGDASPCTAPFECLSVNPSPVLAASDRWSCTRRCSVDADCPSWQATGFCAGAVQLQCADGHCQPRSCH